MSALLSPAANNGYRWDTLGTLNSAVPDLPVILHNIGSKARAAWLVPQLEDLRKEHHST